MHVGFVGMGIMGRPMALNLIKAGHTLTVYNRTASRCDELVEAGATCADSPKAVAEKTDITITMVSDTPDVEQVIFGPKGVAEGAASGNIIIDMSTISSSATVTFAKRLLEQGLDMLDAPVSGGETGAIQGTLSIMVGGEEKIVEQCQPLFEAMGKNIVHIGKNGDGQLTKACNQIAGAVHLIALCESLNLARSAGLNTERVLEAISQGAAGSWMLTHLGPRIIKDDFDPGFMIKLQSKDLRLAIEEIERLGIRSEGAQLAHQLFSQATEKGLGELGTQGLYKLYQ